MIGNRFYDILGLPFGASEQLIKKRYKELAKKYHPDKNPSPDANKRFIEINEAYIYLLSKDKIPAKSFEEQQKEKVEEEQKAYREKAWKYAREKKMRDEEELLEFYRSLRKGWSWIALKSVAILCGIILVVMLVDFSCPHKQYQRL
jgi:curved DNA-binding protein CbpA